MELSDELVENLEQTKLSLVKLPIWFKDDFDKNQKNDLCFESHDGQLHTNIEDYFNICVMDNEDVLLYVREAAMIPVYKKLGVIFNGDTLKESYFIGTTYGLNNIDKKDEMDKLFKEFAQKLNSLNNYYIADEQIAWLDLSREVQQYCQKQLEECLA